MRIKKGLIPLGITVIVLALVSTAMAGDVSRSFKINVYIPVIPGLNAPADETMLLNENAVSEEMITTTETFIINDQKVIMQTIAPK